MNYENGKISTNGWTKRVVDDYLRRVLPYASHVSSDRFISRKNAFTPFFRGVPAFGLCERAESRVYSRENARPMDSKRWPWLTDPFLIGGEKPSLRLVNSALDRGSMSQSRLATRRWPIGCSILRSQFPAIFLFLIPGPRRDSLNLSAREIESTCVERSTRVLSTRF